MFPKLFSLSMFKSYCFYQEFLVPWIDWRDVPPHLCLPGQTFSQRLAEGSLQASHFPYLWALGGCENLQIHGSMDCCGDAGLLGHPRFHFAFAGRRPDMHCTLDASTAWCKSHYSRTKISMMQMSTMVHHSRILRTLSCNSCKVDMRSLQELDCDRHRCDTMATDFKHQGDQTLLIFGEPSWKSIEHQFWKCITISDLRDLALEQ